MLLKVNIQLESIGHQEGNQNVHIADLQIQMIGLEDKKTAM